MSINLPVRLGVQIENILRELRSQSKAECVMLADVSGQLIAVYGQLDEIDPVTVAALAAGDVAAINALVHQIDGSDSHGSFLHEGEHRNIYLVSIANSFILIAIFDVETPIGLMRLFIRRAAERLHPLTAEFEEMVGQPDMVPSADFGATLAAEMDQIFAGA